MAISFDAISASNVSAGSATLNYTSQVVAGNCLIVVVRAIRFSGTPLVITGVTFDGVAMTQRDVQRTDPTNAEAQYTFSLKNPSLGAKTVIVSASATMDFIVSQAISYNNVEDVDVVGTPATAIAATDLTVSVAATIRGAWAVMSVITINTGMVAGAGTTLRGEGNGTGFLDSNGSIGDADTSKNLTATTTPTTGNWNGVALALRPTRTGTDYYVDPSGGADGNNGLTTGTAWQHLSAAQANGFAPGDTLHLRGDGTTHSGSLLVRCAFSTVGAPVIITNYGVGRARIDPGVSYGIRIQDSNYISLLHAHVAGPGLSSSGTFPTKTTSTTSTQPGVHVKTTTTDVWYSGITITDVLVDGCLSGIQVEQAASSTAGYQDCEITQCAVTNCGEFGFVVGLAAAGARAHRRIHLSDCSARGVLGITSLGGNFSGFGFVLSNCSDSTWERSYSADCGDSSDPAAIGGPVGFELVECSNCVIQDCEAVRQHAPEGLDGEGFDIDAGCDHCVIQRFYAHECDGAGIQHWCGGTSDGFSAWSTNVFRFGIVQNCGKFNNWGGYQCERATHAADSPVVHNVTFFIDAAAGKLLHMAAGFTHFYNNIFYVKSGAQFSDSGTATAASVFLGNDWFVGTGSTFFIHLNATDYTSLGALQAAGYEKDGATTYGITSDPLLSSPGGGGQQWPTIASYRLGSYDLGAGSPCIGSGYNLGLVPIDPGTYAFHHDPVIGRTMGAVYADLGPNTIVLGTTEAAFVAVVGGGGGATLITAADGLRVVISESPAVRVSVSVAESLRVALAEANALRVFVRAADSLAVRLTEAAAALVRIAAADASRIGLNESAALVALVRASESLRVGLLESAALFARTPVSDSLAVRLVEQAVILSRVTPADSLRVSLLETAAVANRLAASESLRLTATEQAALVVRISSVDLLRVALSESATLFTRTAAADALAIRLTEQAAILSRVSPRESLTVVLVEAARVLSRSAATDTLRLADSEQAFPVVRVAASESVGSRLTDTTGFLRALTAVADALGLRISEAAALFARLAVSEQDAVLTSEHGVVTITSGDLVSITVQDSLRITVVESAALRAFTRVSESLRVGVGDSAAILVAVRVADALRAGTVESPAVAVIIRSSDSLRVSATETARVLVRITAAEADRLGLTETARVFSRLAVSEAAFTVGLAESAAILARASARDTVAVQVGEQTHTLVRLASAAEALRVSEAEMAATLIGVRGADSVAVIARTEVADVLASVPPGPSPGVPSGGPGEVGWSTNQYRIWPTRYVIRRKW